MTQFIQLDFFKTKEECEIDHLRMIVDEIRVSADKVRRGMYAKLGDLTKENIDLKQRLEIIEKHICKADRL
ncbi:hypothetical protein UFOVP256_31 [uncultured Caudovirales phage]|uniref:Uncharacterized protein n=1 Tax=uncultured Caudovirales phage TaxID=2100421 RepID=A0A6J5LDZ5_9CAUD|nr:hypothetical protein UFOVP256_31 [uncultured Caudovirales phage]